MPRRKGFIGAYNTVRGEVVCPNCATAVQILAQFKYGCVWQVEYEIGDALRWGRNDVGNPGFDHVVIDAVAESVCPKCSFSDEWNLYLHIRRDRLSGLETATGKYDFAKAGENFIVLLP